MHLVRRADEIGSMRFRRHILQRNVRSPAWPANMRVPARSASDAACSSASRPIAGRPASCAATRSSARATPPCRRFPDPRAKSAMDTPSTAKWWMTSSSRAVRPAIRREQEGPQNRPVLDDRGSLARWPGCSRNRIVSSRLAWRDDTERHRVVRRGNPLPWRGIVIGDPQTQHVVVPDQSFERLSQHLQVDFGRELQEHRLVEVMRLTAAAAHRTIFESDLVPRGR